ncbi:hypothetical protein BH09ACT8_BH09ACT8_27260 [soil metagenome]
MTGQNEPFTPEKPQLRRGERIDIPCLTRANGADIITTDVRSEAYVGSIDVWGASIYRTPPDLLECSSNAVWPGADLGSTEVRSPW